MHISLAAKCQILFGAAVVLIISAALFVPWERLKGLIDEVNLAWAEGIANQTVMEHVARETALLGSAPSTDPAGIPATEPADIFPASLPVAGTFPVPGTPTPSTFPATVPSSPQQIPYIWPRIIPVDPPDSMDVGKWERRAIAQFVSEPNILHFDQTYATKGMMRYRLAEPLYANYKPNATYNQSICLNCHADGQSRPTPDQARAAFAAAMSTTRPATPLTEQHLLGIVVVDIPSKTNENELFINHLYILLAGLLAGSVAIAVFYFITTRVILKPVRVLQETAEKVSEGDLNIRSDISTGDEFQQLSETFNTMLVNLKTSTDQLRSSNKALDLKLGQLAETNVALYESNRLKSEFLANVSHELRTPLNSILGFAELLRETVTVAADSKPSRYLQNIQNSGRNLLDLINDLLDLAKIEAGRMDVRSEPLSLGDVFEGLMNLLKPLSEIKHLQVVAIVSAGVPIIQTDPAKLQQVLYNFMSNAIKFSPEGSRVDLLAEMIEDDAVRISVTDQGPGIEPEKHELIFEKFRQIDGSVTRQHSGTGLGLAISKELIHLLGGSIGITSIPGHGATFWVILPLKTQAGSRDVRAKMVL
jgi:signal transduction histidine kinase